MIWLDIQDKISIIWYLLFRRALHRLRSAQPVPVLPQHSAVGPVRLRPLHGEDVPLRLLRPVPLPEHEDRQAQAQPHQRTARGRRVRTQNGILIIPFIKLCNSKNLYQ